MSDQPGTNEQNGHTKKMTLHSSPRLLYMPMGVALHLTYNLMFLQY